MSISSKQYHKNLNAWELSYAKIWGVGVKWVEGKCSNCAQGNIVINHEVSPDHHIKMVAVDILIALLKYNSHSITIHLFKIYNGFQYIHRVVQLSHNLTLAHFHHPRKKPNK